MKMRFGGAARELYLRDGKQKVTLVDLMATWRRGDQENGGGLMGFEHF